ncbi:MAG: Gfo/Idh/MocA family protein, partial [Balneolaceae bacterium]
MDRKTFVKTSSVATLGTVLGAPTILKANHSKNENVRIGFIGTGLRGRNHVNNILATEGVECPVFCDIDPAAVELTLAMFEEREKPKPKVYSDNEWSFREMLEKEDLDGVIISTNWKWHTAMSITAMEAGVFVGVEVSGAFSVDECWDLVDTHERTGTHLMFLENV